MVDFIWTGIAIASMFIYAFHCFYTKNQIFNWKMAGGIILFLFILEIAAHLVNYYLVNSKK